MKIYEMVFSKPLEEPYRKFYKKNTEKTRKNFIDSIKKEIDKEFSELNKFCIKESIFDFFEIYEVIFNESYSDLNDLESRFLKSGYAELKEYISIKVNEIYVDDS